MPRPRRPIPNRVPLPVPRERDPEPEISEMPPHMREIPAIPGPMKDFIDGLFEDLDKSKKPN